MSDSIPLDKLTMLRRIALLFLILVVVQKTTTIGFANCHSYDIIVYGGTSGGVMAAIQASRMGKSVLLVEPTQFLGGLTTGGLGATDIGNKRAIGGLSREFYQRIHKYYQSQDHWRYETRDDYMKNRGNDNAMWTFEPSAATHVINEMIRESHAKVLFGERLDLKKGVVRQGNRIQSIVMESGRSFEATIFIDATYEGDLMALAGVSYHVGREGNAIYGETINGLQKERTIHHQFTKKVDPFVVPGKPDSGLLPGVTPMPRGNDGDGDHRVQAYCFRLCTTDVAENRRDWPKPDGYDEKRYELLLRNFEAGDMRIPWAPIWMPNRKTDTNNNYAFSTDNLGMNYDYPDGDYQTRERIWREHELYTKGLMWTLANSPRVPESVRNVFQNTGLAKDEFLDNDNWPRQLYIREARRLVSDYVMSEKNCKRLEIVADSIGMGAYNMDSHNTQRYVTAEGYARNEGDIQYPTRPYPISYRSICPRESECSNLLVPVCLAASHVAYGSIRMEPVFMVMGQSAATAGAHAVDEKQSVQKISYDRLRERLLADKQVLDFESDPLPINVSVPKSMLEGVVVDDTETERVGFTSESQSVPPFVGVGYVHDGNTSKGEQRIRFVPTLAKGGRYKVYVIYTPASNRATNVPIFVQHAQGRDTYLINQQKSAAIDGFRHLLGEFVFAEGSSGFIEISNSNTDGHVVVDAVQWIAEKD